MSADPAVTTVYPLRWRRGRPEPFPTVFWLADPGLDRRVADLERRGGVRAWEQEIREDATLRAAVLDDHRRYAALRRAMLTPADADAVLRFNLGGVFDGTGVGGTRIGEAMGVKCLHAHVAHALAERNVIGEGVLEALG